MIKILTVVALLYLASAVIKVRNGRLVDDTGG